MNILDKIIENKRREVAKSKLERPEDILRKSDFFKFQPLSFREYLLRDDKNGIIAEYKRKSPSKGVINNTTNVAEAIVGYTKYGASAISILTDHDFFGGSLSDLNDHPSHEIPVLRKDFIIDEYQLIESRSYGADIILLIAGCLDKNQVRTLAATAKDIGLNVLLEIHNIEEADHICDFIDVVGVNNRDLKTFQVDVNRSVELSESIPNHMLKISESGIDAIETIQLLKTKGYSGFLIGERFMREKDPVESFKNFSEALIQNNEV